MVKDFMMMVGWYKEWIGLDWIGVSEEMLNE